MAKWKRCKNVLNATNNVRMNKYHLIRRGTSHTLTMRWWQQGSQISSILDKNCLQYCHPLRSLKSNNLITCYIITGCINIYYWFRNVITLYTSYYMIYFITLKKQPKLLCYWQLLFNLLHYYITSYYGPTVLKVFQGNQNSCLSKPSWAWTGVGPWHHWGGGVVGLIS